MTTTVRSTVTAGGILTRAVSIYRSPIGQAFIKTIVYGAPLIAEAIRQQVDVTPADVSVTTESFASAADVPLDTTEQPTTEPTGAYHETASPPVQDGVDEERPSA